MKSRLRASHYALLAAGLLMGLVAPLGVLPWRTWRELEQEKRDRALISAIEADDLQAVVTSLHQGANPNARQQLHYQEYTSLWQVLRQQFSGQHSPKPAWGDAALFVAMQDSIEDDAEVLLALVKYGARTDVFNADGETPLAVAAEYGRHRMLQALLKRGVNINTRCRDGSTALMRAAWTGPGFEVDFLLKSGADCNLADNKGETALTGMRDDTPHKDRIVARLRQAGAKE